MNERELRCPECDTNEIVGVEVQGVYDGVLYWRCGACRFAWPRWTEGHRGEQAAQHVELANAGRRQHAPDGGAK